MKAYKGFDADMTCKGFRYAEGETYETDEAKLCDTGFHACEDPLDCFSYYPPGKSIYHEVDLDATDEKSDNDSKRVGKRITIGAALNVAGLVSAHIEYIKEHITNESNADPGKPATAGDRGAATAGDGGAATAGDGGAATAGNYGAATSRGKSAVGENGIACARGNGCQVKGGFGAVLVLGEENRDSFDLVTWQAVMVDGENIKADTWYRLEDGKFTEVADQ